MCRVGCVSLETMNSGSPREQPFLSTILYLKMWGYSNGSIGLKIRGTSVQLLGNKYEEDNSGRQKSGLGGEMERERCLRLRGGGKEIEEDGGTVFYLAGFGRASSPGKEATVLLFW